MPEENIKPFEFLMLDDEVYKTHLTKKFRNRKKYEPANPGLIKAFIPGMILKVYTRKGRKVNEGDKLLILEAMKMQNIVRSPVTGKVKALHVKKNQRVHKDQLMIVIE
ncbi:MAG: biotin/lipoyl-binding protein [Chlorobi bacterium]|nr:biotin/lipoyl-binding protein [Chlorobiota bacterium]